MLDGIPSTTFECLEFRRGLRVSYIIVSARTATAIIVIAPVGPPTWAHSMSVHVRALRKLTAKSKPSKIAVAIYPTAMPSRALSKMSMAMSLPRAVSRPATTPAIAPVTAPAKQPVSQRLVRLVRCCKCPALPENSQCTCDFSWSITGSRPDFCQCLYLKPACCL